jgi:membrane fusion protein (multidrug efflux system)
VKLRIRTGNFTDAILVPQQAINQLQNIYQVFVLNDSNKVVPTIIKPGKRVGANWIVSAGLKAGDKVAVIGSTIVKPNIVVTPKPIPWSYDSTMRQ